MFLGFCGFWIVYFRLCKSSKIACFDGLRFFGPAFRIVVQSPIVLGDWGKTGTLAQVMC